MLKACCVDVMLCYATLWYVRPCYDMRLRVPRFMLCLLYYGTLMLCLCCVMLCYDMLCYDRLYYVMCRHSYVMFWHAMLCYGVFM